MNEAEVIALKSKLDTTFDLETVEKLISYYDERNDYDELTKLYNLVLEKNPFDTEALNNLGVICTDFYHDYSKARKLYEKALNVDDTLANVHYNYGSLMEFAFKNYEEAKTHYEKAIELDNYYVDAYLNLSWLLLEHFDDSEHSLSVINNGLKYEEDSYLYSQKGYIEMTWLQDYDSARGSLTKAIDLDCFNELALSYMGKLSFLEDDNENAKEYYERALSTNKLNEFLINEYGRFLMTVSRDFEKAIQLFKKAIQAYPDNVIYYCYLANLNFIIGNIMEAHKYLLMAENFELTQQDALLMIGYLKVMINHNKDEAIMYFEKVIELNPNNINALSMIGFYNLIENHQVDVALDYFKKIAEINPGQYFIIDFIVAQIYIQYYGDYKEALNYLYKINTDKLSKQDLSHLYYLLGHIYENFYYDFNKALDYYEKAYELKKEPFLKQLISNIYSKYITIVN